MNKIILLVFQILCLILEIISYRKGNDELGLFFNALVIILMGFILIG